MSHRDDEQRLRVLDTIIFVGWRLLLGFVLTAALIVLFAR